MNLVFGKTVRIRHYPVTVSAESLACCSKPLGSSILGRPFKLGEAQVRRPARGCRAWFNFAGRVEEHIHVYPFQGAWWLPFLFPLCKAARPAP
jgi:hypothetical protein